jgi:signal transduction histidine kinase
MPPPAVQWGMAGKLKAGGGRKRKQVLPARKSARAAPALPGALAAYNALDAVRLRQKAIERAKLEWEGTADALAVMVCLLAGGGQVIRTNRVVEDWRLGSVAAAVGRPIHGLLHPRCRKPDCLLASFALNALRAIRAGSRSQFELQERIGKRSVQLTLRPLRKQHVEVADADVPLAVLVATDQSALRHVRDELELLNTSLEARVRGRTQALANANRDLRSEIERREQAEVALRRSRNELAALSGQRLSAQEKERKRIAVELHDSVGQSLSAVKYTLERGLELLRQPQRGDPQPVLQLAVARIQECAENIRAISSNLRPKILDDLGVASAVQWFCRQYAETYPALDVVTEISVADRAVPARLATEVYRCLQELLNNVAKHAAASEVHVRLAVDNQALELLVRDNGVGVSAGSPDAHRSGSGLRNLRERARLSGGQFGILRGRRGGTTARLSWPLADPSQDPAPGGAG